MLPWRDDGSVPDKASRNVELGVEGQHRVHLRTTNPIDSTVATVRLRQHVTKGAGSVLPGLPWPTS